MFRACNVLLTRHFHANEFTFHSITIWIAAPTTIVYVESVIIILARFNFILLKLYTTEHAQW